VPKKEVGELGKDIIEKIIRDSCYLDNYCDTPGYNDHSGSDEHNKN